MLDRSYSFYRPEAPRFEIEGDMPVDILSTGHERRSNRDYCWNNELHAAAHYHIFQYTLSGAGYFEFDRGEKRERRRVERGRIAEQRRHSLRRPEREELDEQERETERQLREVEAVQRRLQGLPPLPEEGAHSLDEMWNNATYFLKAVIPVAQESGVRLALHPNDPPAPISRGSGQIMGTVAGWKKYTSIVDSPSNGITFDCGVTREMGEDPVEVCRYFASRDRINHMHYRNVRVIKPYERYTEVAIDEGQVDMFAVMKELVKNKYRYQIYPEHPRRLDYDAERGRIAGYHCRVVIGHVQTRADQRDQPQKQ